MWGRHDRGEETRIKIFLLVGEQERFRLGSSRSNLKFGNMTMVVAWSPGGRRKSRDREDYKGGLPCRIPICQKPCRVLLAGLCS